MQLMGRLLRPRHRAVIASLVFVSLIPVPSVAVGQTGLRIMPMGDSITQGKGGDATYRYFLWHHLLDAGESVDFVGSLSGVKGRGEPKYPDFDQDHEGHSGMSAKKLVNYAEAFAAAAEAQIVLLHLGTNDILKGQTIPTIRKDLAKIVSELRLANPQMVILLAEIIPIAGMEAQVVELNAQIRSLAIETNTSNSPVITVDHYTGFDVNVDLYDGVHATESGYAKMGSKWFAALADVLGGVSPPPNSPTQVTLTKPSEGSVFPSGSPIELQASVSGDQAVAKVVFTAAGVSIGEDAASPYQLSWSGAGDGTIELQAHAHEEGGAVVSSPTVSITVGDPAVGSEVLLVVGNPQKMSAGDKGVLQRLTSLGLSVTIADDDGIAGGAATGKVLVLISATVNSGKVGSALTGSPVPLITWEGGVFDDLGMTGATYGVDFGETAGTDLRQNITVVNHGHPLAGGLSGTVTVSDPASKFMWGSPATGATLVATLENEPDKYALFGYESGVAMASGSAPARRVGLFIHEATTLTGAGWATFDAAVQWALGP